MAQRKSTKDTEETKASEEEKVQETKEETSQETKDEEQSQETKEETSQETDSEPDTGNESMVEVHNPQRFHYTQPSTGIRIGPGAVKKLADDGWLRLQLNEKILKKKA